MSSEDKSAERKQAIRRSGFSADDIPTDIFAGIGEIVVWWGYIEFQLGVLIREGFNLSPATGRVFTIGAGFKVMCSALRTMTYDETWIKDETLRKDIGKLANKIMGNANQRHDYAHGVFGFFMDEPGSFARYLFKEKQHRIKPDSEKITPESLKKIAEDARDLGIEAQDLTVRIKSWKRSVGLHRPR